jgi:hypothetical protein
MRKIMLFSILTAVISVSLTIAAALQYSFLTGTAASSVKVIETQFIDSESLNSDQSRTLKRHLIRLRGGEAYLSKLQHDLWWVSVLGFGVISLLSGFTAWLVFRANLSIKRDKLKPTF